MRPLPPHGSNAGRASRADAMSVPAGPSIRSPWPLTGKAAAFRVKAPPHRLIIIGGRGERSARRRQRPQQIFAVGQGSGRSRIGAIAFEQLLQFDDLSWLDERRIESCGRARLADVRALIATEGDQAELRRRKSLAETMPQSIPFIPGIERSTMAHSGRNVSANESALEPSAATATS